MGWFGPRPLIEEDEFEWQLATFKWLLERFGGPDLIVEAESFIPDERLFPVSSPTRPGRASEYFDHVRRLAGMEDWPCRLEAGDEDTPQQIAPGIAMVRETPGQPLGTFSVETIGDKAECVIRYHPALVDDPAALIATFAHELSHYLIHDRAEAPPGGWELDELATDLTAVYLGFGIFLANNAKQFEGFSSFDQMGWQSRRSGYLSEAALVTALAIRERLGGRDPLQSAGPHLKTYLQTDLKKADAWLRKYCPDVEAALAQVDLDDFQPDEASSGS